MRLCAAYKVFNGALYLPYSLRSIYDFVDRIIIFLSTAPWNGPIVPLDNTEEVIRNFPDPQGKIRLIVRNCRYHEPTADGYKNEFVEMNEILSCVVQETPQNTHYLYIDADEVYQPDQIQKLRDFLEANPQIDVVHAPWRTYWKSFRYWIDPMEPHRPLVAFKIMPHTAFSGIRQVNNTHGHTFEGNELFFHHFSYSLTTEMVQAKIKAWSHCNEIRQGWFENVWLAWDKNREMEELHPAWASAFRKAVRVDDRLLPEVMKTHPFYGKDIV